MTDTIESLKEKNTELEKLLSEARAACAEYVSNLVLWNDSVESIIGKQPGIPLDGCDKMQVAAKPFLDRLKKLEGIVERIVRAVRWVVALDVDSTAYENISLTKDAEQLRSAWRELREAAEAAKEAKP